MATKFRKHYIWIIILIAFIVRLYRIHYPLLDWHSWRQADTASVTREFIKQGINLLKPKYHDLSSIPSGLDNSEHGYRMVEFPFINAGIAIIIKIFPFLPLVQTSRFISIVFSIGTLIFLYLFIKDISDKKTALLTAVGFAFLPYSIYYSRVILPEPFLNFFSITSLYLFNKYLKDHKLSDYINSLICLAFALLLKPIAAFLAPVYFILILNHKTIKKIYKNIWIYFIYGVLSFSPLLLWRQWILNFPQGIPASEWLFNGKIFNGEGARFKLFWFRWIFIERIWLQIIGLINIIFIPFNIFKFDKSLKILIAWWIGIITYFTVIATGNVKHDYYQIFSIPLIAFTLGRGMKIFLDILNKKNQNQKVNVLIVLTLFIISINYSWKKIQGHFNVNTWEYMYAGQAVDQLTPANSKVIAPVYAGDTMFLFQTNRIGWPTGGDIQNKINQGAQFYVSINLDQETRELMNQYKTVKQTDKYVIVDLTQPKQ